MKSRVKKEWFLGSIIEHDLSAAGRALRARWTGDIDNVYRVAIVGTSVEVMCLGMDVDVSVEGIYNSTSELPMWMQERLAVLSMMKVNPPQTKIEGVGMRVDESVYWVLRGE
jgi:hypothetical protein